MNKTAKIVLWSTVVVGGITFIVINKTRKKKQVAEILRIIQEGIGEAGDITDLTSNLNKADAAKINSDPNAKARAAKAATAIMLAKGTATNFYQDDEDAVYDALRTLNSQAEVKLVNGIIQASKKVSLTTWLGFLSTSEMDIVNGILSKLK